MPGIRPVRLCPPLSEEHLDRLARQLAPYVADQLAQRLAPHLAERCAQAIQDALSAAGPPDALRDTEEACAFLNVSRRKFEQLVAEGQLRPIRIGRKRLFTQDQLDAFVRACMR